MAKKNTKEKETVPLNRRPGRCGNCANGGFTLHLHKGVLYRKCKGCSELVDIDSGEVKRNGDVSLVYQQEGG